MWHVFSVGYNIIENNDILDIHKSLIIFQY